jgi:nucleotide-binding universal stress UspA family protein
MNAAGVPTRGKLALGDPATELIKTVESEAVDLIAMSTHGHRFLNDLLRGTTVNRVRHEVQVPVLLLRAKR